MLVKTVEELEGEALKRLGVSYRDSLEASSKKSSLSVSSVKLFVFCYREVLNFELCNNVVSIKCKCLYFEIYINNKCN